MTAKDLKNALLQEAVQGKLVPQIASEGNARDLLEEIRKEKLSHGFANSYGICGEKGKKSKSSDLRSKSQIRVTTEITEDEIPFDIPESWCWCRLGEIVQLTSGQDLQPEMYNSSQKGIPYITGASNFNNGNVIINRWTETPKSVAIKDDLLLTCKGTVGEMAFLKEKKVHIARQVMSIRSSEKISLGYVKIYLTTQIENLKSKAKSMIPGIAREDVISSLIPLPPLSEQKRIVAAIEKFMPLIEEYGKKETQLKAINEKIGTLTKKAILQEAVQGKLVPQIAGEGNAKKLLEEIKKEKSKFLKEGKIKKEKPLPEITEDEIPFDIPESWCWCRLSELCNLYTGDSINETEKKLKYTNVKEGWFYIGTKDVNFDQTINYDNGIKIPFEIDNFRIAPKNTVLMCIEGGSAGRKIAFTNQDVCFGNKLCCFNSYKNEIEKFIFYFLQSTLFTDAFKDNINGIIGGVSINNLKGMLFPLPPLAEQKRIVNVIEKMLPLCEKLGE